MKVELCGLPGVGKSTFARALAERLRIDVITMSNSRAALVRKHPFAALRAFPGALSRLGGWVNRSAFTELESRRILQDAQGPGVVEEGILHEIWRRLVREEITHEQWARLLRPSEFVVVMLHADNSLIQQRLVGRQANLPLAEALRESPTTEAIWTSANAHYKRLLSEAERVRTVVHVDHSVPTEEAVGSFLTQIG